jgi:hypothetical protein
MELLTHSHKQTTHEVFTKETTFLEKPSEKRRPSRLGLAFCPAIKLNEDLIARIDKHLA